MLPVAELELVPGQQISSDEVMNLAKILAPFWSHFRRDCGPFAPYGPELQAYCNEIARGNPPPIKPLKCPDCGAEVRVVIGKKPGRAGIYIFFCIYFERDSKNSTKEKTCGYLYVPDQCGPTVEQIAHANELRAADMRAMFDAWYEKNNVNNLAAPTTDEEATEWLLKNNVLLDEDEPPAVPSSQSTPRKEGSSRNFGTSLSQSAWSNISTPAKSTPTKAPGSSHSTWSNWSQSTPSPKKPSVSKGKAKAAPFPLFSQDYSDIFVNKGDYVPPPSNQLALQPLRPAAPSTSGSRPATAASAGKVLVASTPESSVPDSEDGPSSSDEAPPPKRPRTREVFDGVVIPLRRVGPPRGVPPNAGPSVYKPTHRVAAGGSGASTSTSNKRSSSTRCAPGGRCVPGGSLTGVVASTSRQTIAPPAENDDGPHVDIGPPAPILDYGAFFWQHATVWQPLIRRRIRGHEIEVTGLMFDCSIEIYNRATATWDAFDRDAEYEVLGPGDTIYLRKAGLTEIKGFLGMLIHDFMSGIPFAVLPRE